MIIEVAPGAQPEPLAGYWTIAFRKPTANRFQRVTNWSGTWQQATDLGNAYKIANPGLQVYTTPDRAHDLARPEHEDAFNILVDSGKRVRIADTATLDSEWLALTITLRPDPSSTHSRPGFSDRERAAGLLRLALPGLLCDGDTPYSSSTFTCAGEPDGSPCAAVHSWTVKGETRHYCGYHSPFDRWVEAAGDPAPTPTPAPEESQTTPAPVDTTPPTLAAWERELLNEGSNVPDHTARKFRVGYHTRFDTRGHGSPFDMSAAIVTNVGSKWIYVRNADNSWHGKILRTLCTPLDYR